MHAVEYVVPEKTLQVLVNDGFLVFFEVHQIGCNYPSRVSFRGVPPIRQRYPADVFSFIRRLPLVRKRPCRFHFVRAHVGGEI